MTPLIALVLLTAAGVVLATLGFLGLRASGADMRTARRLAGAQEIPVGQLDTADHAGRPVRVAGRIRCRDPLRAASGERLVAYQRDVEVRLPGGWRTIERVRETRSFELWDHDGAVTIDPARAAEPLLTIPSVWRGRPDELEEPHASAAAALTARHGAATEARATTRSVSVTDRLLVVGLVGGDAARATLEPMASGYLITNLGLHDAMRLMGGTNRRLTTRSVIAIGVGATLAAVGLAGTAATLVLAA